MSLEWEDVGMDRHWGSRESLRFVRAAGFAPAERLSTPHPLRD
jgi:hypothetical protein